MDVIGYFQLRLFHLDSEMRKVAAYFLRELGTVNIEFDEDNDPNTITVNGVDYYLVNCFAEGEGKYETIKLTVKKEIGSEEVSVLDLLGDVVDDCDENASLYILVLITESKEYKKIPHLVKKLEDLFDKKEAFFRQNNSDI